MSVDLFMTLYLTAVLAVAAGVALDDTYGAGVSWAERAVAAFCGLAAAAMWAAQIARWLS